MAAVAAPAPRFVAGLPWEKDDARPSQVVLTLEHSDARTLRCEQRLARLERAAGPGTRLQIVDRGALPPRLLITGKASAVEEARASVLRLLGDEASSGTDGSGGGELVVSLHCADVDQLQRCGCALLSEIEGKSGCRMLIKGKPSTAVGGWRSMTLFGSQAEQAIAVRLLAEVCTEAVQPGRPPQQREGFQDLRFDILVRGSCIELAEENTVARRTSNVQSNLPAHCVAACPWQPLTATGGTEAYGAQVRLRVRRVESRFDAPRGAMRLAVSSLRPRVPAPESLHSGPELSWALGRGCCRGPDGRTARLRGRGAHLDANLREGDELILFVAAGRSELAVYRWRVLTPEDMLPDPTESETTQEQTPGTPSHAGAAKEEASAGMQRQESSKSAATVPGSENSKMLSVIVSDQGQEAAAAADAEPVDPWDEPDDDVPLVEENGGMWRRLTRWTPDQAPDVAADLYFMVELAGRVQEVELLPLGSGLPTELLLTSTEIVEDAPAELEAQAGDLSPAAARAPAT
eukprot:TRINITY_DN27698_c1_g2_i1.p1 TRINITY_DN27698_c1_g2~~TRINITY_DN27698_c1_g2_i1.p1  ORF type:complete len:539 (-),score=110.91 TRINITY_DN27698_c1_g2_i1:87-1643(-)